MRKKIIIFNALILLTSTSESLIVTKNKKTIQTISEKYLSFADDVNENPKLLESKSKSPSIKSKVITKISSIAPKLKIPKFQPIRMAARRTNFRLKSISKSIHPNLEGGSGPIQPSSLDSERQEIWKSRNNEEQYSFEETKILEAEKEYEKKQSIFNEAEKQYKEMQKEIIEEHKKNSKELTETERKIYEIDERMIKIKEKYEIKLARVKLLLAKLEVIEAEEKVQAAKYEFNNVSKNFAITFTELAEAQLNYKIANEKLLATTRKKQIDQIEKSNNSLKLTITTKTWATIVQFLKENSTKDFLNKLKNKFSFFYRVEFLRKRDVITNDDINSFANLINNHFSYYYFLFRNLDDNQAIKITSFTGYPDGYWNDDEHDIYNEIIGEKSYDTTIANVKFLAELQIEEAERKILETKPIVDQVQEQKNFPEIKITEQFQKILLEHANAVNKLNAAKAKFQEAEITLQLEKLLIYYEYAEAKFNETQMDLIKVKTTFLLKTIDFWLKLAKSEDNLININRLEKLLSNFNKEKLKYEIKIEEWNKVEEKLNSITNEWTLKWEKKIKEKLKYENTLREWIKEKKTKENFLEKYYKLSSDELKLTITAETWKEISLLFFNSFSKDDFLNRLKELINTFEKEDHSGWLGSINDDDITSLAMLIYEHFSFYNNLFRNLNVNQAIKITSYSGYEQGYFDINKSFLNEVITKKQILTKEKELINDETLQIAEQEFKITEEKYYDIEEEVLKVEKEYCEAEEEFLVKLIEFEMKLTDFITIKAYDEIDKMYEEWSKVYEEWSKTHEKAKEI